MKSNFGGLKSPARQTIGSRILGFAICGLTGASFSQTVSAQIIPGQDYKCDFAQVIGQCKAVSSPNGSGGFHLFTDALRCTSVDYATDGRMRRLFMKDGRGVDNKAGKDLKIASCKTYAAIDAPKPVAPPKPVAGPSMWQQPNPPRVVYQLPSLTQSAIQHGGATTTQIPGLTPGQLTSGYQALQVSSFADTGTHAEPAEKVDVKPEAAPQVAAASSMRGKWCDATGAVLLDVFSDGMEMLRPSGQKVAIGFLEKKSDGASYRAKQLFSTFSGTVQLASNGDLIWRDFVTPGIRNKHRLSPCKPTDAIVSQNF